MVTASHVQPFVVGLTLASWYRQPHLLPHYPLDGCIPMGKHGSPQVEGANHKRRVTVLANRWVGWLEFTEKPDMSEQNEARCDET